MILGVLAMAMTAGAAPPPETYPVRGDSGHVCNVGKAKTLVGRRRSARVEAEALLLTGAASLRWIAPNTMVTMDYRPDRLNLHLDRRGRILRINCG